MASAEHLGKFPEGKVLLISPVASVSEFFSVSFNDYIIQTVTGKINIHVIRRYQFCEFSPTYPLYDK